MFNYKGSLTIGMALDSTGHEQVQEGSVRGVASTLAVTMLGKRNKVGRFRIKVPVLLSLAQRSYVVWSLGPKP